MALAASRTAFSSDSGALQQHGLKRVSVAGHPEGHPKVQQLRAAGVQARCDNSFTLGDGDGFKV